MNQTNQTSSLFLFLSLSLPTIICAILIEVLGLSA